MKKFILVTMLTVLLLCVPVQAQKFSTWLWNDDDATGARIGYFTTDTIEVGVSASWLSGDGEPVTMGFFGLYHLEEVIKIPNPILLEFLPEEISGTPYVGARIDFDLDTNQSTFSPVTGIMFEKVFFFEYRYKSIVGVKDGMFIGFRIPF